MTERALILQAEAKEKLARIMHESGRAAVEARKIYRSDLPVKPFAEWEELDENTKEGRRMMAQYLVDVAEVVVPTLLALRPDMEDV